MAEYTYNPVQLVAPSGPILFNNSIPCNRGYVLHRNESGVFTLRGVVNNNCANFARYQVTFNGNIAVSTGQTVGPIAIAISQAGEPILTSRAIVTPAAVEDYFNVTSTAIITVYRGCCSDISVENVSPTVGNATETTVPINVVNANITITRVA